MINLNKHFRATAVVDWLILEFHTLSATPAWRLWKEHEDIFSYVTGLDPETGEDIAKVGAQGANTPTTRFAVRIQNPTRFADLESAVDQVPAIDVSVPFSITAIEVSFDLYARAGTTERDLIEMTAYLVRSINRVSSEPPRFYKLAGETHWPALLTEMLAALRDGFTVGYGNRDDDAYLRIYFKKTDNGTLLPTAELRSRAEIRLQGEACPVRNFDDLRTFNFASLGKFFRFNDTADVPGLIGQLLPRRITHGGVVDANGELVPAFRNKGRKRKKPMHTVASPLNDIARDQLKKLTRRWQAPAGRGKRPLKSCAKRYGFPGGLGLHGVAPKHRHVGRPTGRETRVAARFPTIPSHVQTGRSVQANTPRSNN